MEKMLVRTRRAVLRPCTNALYVQGLAGLFGAPNGEENMFKDLQRV